MHREVSTAFSRQAAGVPDLDLEGNFGADRRGWPRIGAGERGWAQINAVKKSGTRGIKITIRITIKRVRKDPTLRVLGPLAR